jgi:hypothetical protein
LLLLAGLDQSLTLTLSLGSVVGGDQTIDPVTLELDGIDETAGHAIDLLTELEHRRLGILAGRFDHAEEVGDLPQYGSRLLGGLGIGDGFPSTGEGEQVVTLGDSVLRRSKLDTVQRGYGDERGHDDIVLVT